MPLEDLNERLYEQDSNQITGHEHEQSKYDPVIVKSQDNPFLQEEKKWDPAQKGFSPSQKKKLKIGLSIFFGLVFLIGLGAFYNWWIKDAFHQDRVSISFEGPKSADSTQPSKYLIHYKNDNRVILQKAEIRLSYSENFQPNNNVNLKQTSPTSGVIFLGDIAAKSEKTLELNGIFYAPKDTPIYIHGGIYFVPSNGSSQLSMENQIGVVVSSSPVLLEVSAPQQAVSGNNIEYVVDYKNLDTRRLEGIQINIDFPPGFKMITSQPIKSQDSKWIIGNLESGQGGQIRIQGVISGQTDENKNINVEIGHIGVDGKLSLYNRTEKDSKIIVPVLAITQRLEGSSDGVINAGDNLKYVISYQNTGALGLRDAIITAEIKGLVLDYAKVNAENGSFDSIKNTITWKASEVAGLANIEPKAGGSVSFSVPVKAVIPVLGKNDKNFVITTVAKIDSMDIPTPIDSNKVIGSDILELKLASKVLFDTQGFYNDSTIKNTGPLPMVVGKETTFTIHWKVSTVSNDLENASIVSSLPAGVRWIGNISPNDEKVIYNERTNQLRWDIGNVQSSVGILSAPRQIAFQIGIKPQINQAGQALNILNKSTLTAKDAFVGKDITLENPLKNSQLTEDSSVGYEGGKVSGGDN